MSLSSRSPGRSSGRFPIPSWRAPGEVLPPLLIAAGAFLVFSRVLGNGFLGYDDGLYVTDNPIVQAGPTLRGIAWALTTHHGSNYWHPLTWFSHMLDCRLFGLSAGWHHAGNAVLHAINAALLYLVFRGMTGVRGRSAVVALLFALHPLHVESVAWLSERKDVLSTFFWLGGMAAYLRYVRRPSWPRMVLVGLLFVLGLMSKPMLVTFPFTLLLLDYWPLGRTRLWRPEGSETAAPRTLASLVREKTPLFILSALATAVNIAVHPRGAIAGFGQLTLSDRLTNAVVSYALYIGKMLWPAHLAILYPYLRKGPSAILAAALVLALLSAIVIRQARRRPYLCFGWLWFLGTLVPVIGIVQVGVQAMADRYTYMPLVGLFVILVWGAIDLAEGARFGKALLTAAAALSIAACIPLTWSQLGYWKDTQTLYERALAVTRGNWLVHYNLACLLAARGDFTAAIPHYTESLRINPAHPEAWNNLGTALEHVGRIPDAIEKYQQALKLDPGLVLAHDNLGWLLAEQGRLDEAIVTYRAAARLDPQDMVILRNLGQVQLARGALDDAISSFRTVLARDPRDRQARVQLGIAFSQRGQAEDATVQFRGALQDNPDDPAALNGLAWILATSDRADLRDGAEAVRIAQHASELTGGTNPLVLDTLAAAYAEAGRFEEAVSTAEAAIKSLGAAVSPAARQSFVERLHGYESGRPFRERPPEPRASVTPTVPAPRANGVAAGGHP